MPSLSRFSPDYPDTDLLGSFNPNTLAADPLGGFNPHTFASPPLRRGPLSYGGSSPSASSFPQFSAGCSQPAPNLFGGMSQGDSIMADMINDGSQHAHYTYTQEEEEPYTSNDTEEREEWADGTEEPVVAAPKGKKKGAAEKKKSGGGGRGPKWTAKEDECLAEAWKVVSLDPFTGANPSDDTYWRRVKTAYDERRVIDREFASMTHDRNESGLSHRWQMIQQACNKWHGIQEEARRRPASGSSAHDQMVAMFTAFRDDNDDAKFKFIQVFVRIETCDKWTETRAGLAKTGTYDPTAAPPAAAEGRPIGHKKAKAMRDAAPATEHLYTCIEKCMSDAAAQAAKRDELAAKREEVAASRWATVIKKQDDKLEILKANVLAKKRREDLLILTCDTTGMDDEVRAWYDGQRRLILAEARAPASAPQTAATATSTLSAPSLPDTTTAATSTPPAGTEEPLAPAEDEVAE
ncbi:hypothetical protein BRADI_4g20543v3 [Brachypodium distachyon]|uniref:No apical meristem-associated C-terminal domain-containing protein n=1 Tax=Brachypodium distachyon TaxID=15368 RepID=A0A0Q3IQY6_BRADI|nr:hypothetical protein BRADI_4g20543v3 [Brachypodium distachyon]